MTPRTALIADDDRLLGESLGEVLSDLGWRTHLAGDGQGAIRVLSATSLDLLLSDVDMPDMTGFQLLAWVRGRTPPAPPVVLMSARGDDQLRATARAQGAIDLLPKPVEVGRLQTLVRQLYL